MRTAVEGGASRARALPAPGPALTASAAAALAVWMLFFGGGSRDDPLVWIGAAALAAAGLAVAAALSGRLPWPWPGRAGLAFIGLLAAFVVWNGVSIAWSIQADRTWSYTNRGLVYLALACLGMFVGALVPRAPRRVAAGLAVLLGLVLAWALAGKVVPALFPDGARVARLRSPIGYWNALSLLGDAAIGVALWACVRREHHRAVRAGGAVLLYAAVVSVLLTYSRSGVVIGAVVAAAWLALDRSRLETLAALAVSAPLGGLVAAVTVATLHGVADDGQAHADRVRDGAYFGIVVIAGALLVWGAAIALLAYEHRGPIPAERRSLLVRRTLLAAGAAGVVALAVLLIRAGGPGPWLDARLDEFTTVQVQPSQGPGRIGSFSSSNRWTWWKEAWHGFADHPLGGTGAGSFGTAHRVLRKTYSPPVTEPHNVALQFLSETGLVGLLLIAGAAAAAAVAVRASIRRAAGPDRAAALALAVGAIGYGLHALVDFDWDFVAVTGPLFLVLGILAGSTHPPVHTRAREPLWALGTLALALAGLFSLVTPWLAERKLNQALEAAGRGNLAGTVDASREAHTLNPLALEPLLVWASAEAATNDIPEAKRLYRQAVELQPKSAQAWYEFGAFELDVDKFPLRAYQYLNRSYTLDPFGPASGKGGKLDQAKRVVNQAATRRGRARGAPPASP